MRYETLSVSAELAELATVLEGSRALCAALRARALHEDTPVTQVPAFVGATLALVIQRLRDLGRASRGELDPARLLTSANRVDPGDPGDDPDLRLTAWADGRGARAGASPPGTAKRALPPAPRRARRARQR